MSEPRRWVGKHEAMRRLEIHHDDEEGDTVHTLLQANIIIGADWPLEDIEEVIDKYGVEEAGELASKMGHTLVVIREDGPLFIEARATDFPREEDTKREVQG